MFILLFATLYRTAAETDIAEDAKGIAMIDETDDSCSRHPLDGAADDRCTCLLYTSTLPTNREV